MFSKRDLSVEFSLWNKFIAYVAGTPVHNVDQVSCRVDQVSCRVDQAACRVDQVSCYQVSC